jgi:hypothetical protein
MTHFYLTVEIKGGILFIAEKNLLIYEVLILFSAPVGNVPGE